MSRGSAGAPKAAGSVSPAGDGPAARAPSIAVVRLALFLVLGLGLLLLTSHPGQVALKSALLLPAVFASMPLDPLAWVTPTPWRESFGFDYGVGTVEGDVYLPGGTGRRGAIILLLGARPLARDDPILVRFAEGLSRTGVVVMIPASSNLAAGRVLPEEVDAIVLGVELLRARDDVDPDRLGIIGFSVGGSLATLAATDPRLEGKLAFVNTFGGYNDAQDLLRAVASRSLRYAGVDQAWEPHSLTIWVVARQIVDTLPAGADRDLLERIYLDGEQEARKRAGQLSPLGRAVMGLLDGLPPEAVEPAIQALPESSKERLRRISPSQAVARLHTPLFVMHDRGDRFIPFTESRRLVAQVPAARLERFAEFELFDHVVPDRPWDSLAILPELARLYAQIYWQLLRVL